MKKIAFQTSPVSWALMQCVCMALSFIWSVAHLHGTVYPIQFSIPECKIIREIPLKTRDFAHIIPGRIDTYIYDYESEYYRGYQQSYFAITCKRGGWDCLRHYEILANGCIPYFLDLDQCDEKTLYFLPKDLILEAMHLEGVSQLKIDHSIFDKNRYYEILNKLLSYAREHLTCQKMAKYLLKTVHYTGRGPILYLSEDPSPDYLRCLTLIGLKELQGEKIVDFPKIGHIYKTYSDAQNLYGKGFTYTKILEDLPVDRSCIEQRIRNREFEIVIYGSVHRGLPFNDLVCQIYNPEQIIYLCGDDVHRCDYPLYLHSSPLFLREFEGNDL